MTFINTNHHFGWVTIFLHWLMAILITGLLVLGLYMTSLPIGVEKLKFYGWHKAFGILVLMLACIRISWRLSNQVPTLPVKHWEYVFARTVQLCLYILMVVMPITGWLMTSAAGLRPSFFGWFLLPALVGPNETLQHLFRNCHEYLAYTLMALIVLHVAGALKHHFIEKNDILRRMLPW